MQDPEGRDALAAGLLQAPVLEGLEQSCVGLRFVRFHRFHGIRGGLGTVRSTRRLRLARFLFLLRRFLPCRCLLRQRSGEGHDTFERTLVTEALGRELDPTKADHAAGLFERILDRPHQPRPRQRRHQVFEVVAADLVVLDQSPMQAARGLPPVLAEHRHDLPQSPQLLRARLPETLKQRVTGRANIADAAGPPRILEVAEMLEQAQHAAHGRFGIARDQVKLRPLVLPLPAVVQLPVIMSAPNALIGIDHGAPVDPKFLERPLEDQVPGRHARLQLFIRLRLTSEQVPEPLQMGRVGIVAIPEELVGAAVRPRVHENSPRRLTVASGPANLLVITFKSAGQRGVDDRSDIRLVDAHAESNGRHDHFEAAIEKAVLHEVALVTRHTRVIGRGREIVLQLRGKLLGILARAAVDDSRTQVRFLEQFPRFLSANRRRRFDDLDGDVLTAETMDETGTVSQSKLLDDVVLHQRRGRGGQPDDGRRTEHRNPFAQAAVLGTEIVSPLRNAMRFIDRDQRRRALGKHLGKARNGQPLGRDVEVVELTMEIGKADLP